MTPWCICITYMWLKVILNAKMGLFKGQEKGKTSFSVFDIQNLQLLLKIFNNVQTQGSTLNECRYACDCRYCMLQVLYVVGTVCSAYCMLCLLYVVGIVCCACCMLQVLYVVGMGGKAQGGGKVLSLPVSKIYFFLSCQKAVCNYAQPLLEAKENVCEVGSSQSTYLCRV